MFDSKCGICLKLCKETDNATEYDECSKVSCKMY